MSFQPVNLALWSNVQNPNTPPSLPQWWGYLTVDDNIATVSGAGYFNIDPGALLQSTTFKIGDLIYAVCTDGSVELSITALTPNITTATATINVGPNSVNTAAIQNLAVTAAKIANATITTTQIAAAAGILGSQLSAAAAIAGTQLAAGANIAGSQLAAAAGIVGTQLAANTVATGQLDPTTIQYVKVPMTAAQFNGMYDAPMALVAAPGAGKQIIVRGAVLAMTFVAAQYAAGGVVALQYDSTVHGAGPLASSTIAAATVNGYAASSDVGVSGADTSGASSAKTNKGLYLSNDTAAFTTGDGTWNIHVWYEIVTL